MRRRPTACASATCICASAISRRPTASTATRSASIRRAQRNGAAFLSSGRYHHHLGLNVWQSAGAGRRDETATGLAWFSLEIEKPDLFAAQEERLRQAGVEVATVANGIEAADPWGTRVRLIKV